MRFEDQGAHGTALVRDLFLFGQEDGRFLGVTEHRIMGVWGGIVQAVGKSSPVVIMACWVWPSWAL